jgi:hypothetical protein
VNLQKIPTSYEVKNGGGVCSGAVTSRPSKSESLHRAEPAEYFSESFLVRIIAYREKNSEFLYPSPDMWRFD